MTGLYISIHYDVAREPPFRIVRTYSAEYASTLRHRDDCVQQLFIYGYNLGVGHLVANDDVETMTGRQFFKFIWPRIGHEYECNHSCPGYIPGYQRCLQYQIRKLIEEAVELLIAACVGDGKAMRAEWADVITMINGIRKFHRDKLL